MPEDEKPELCLDDLSPDELRLVTFLFFHGSATAEEIKEHLEQDSTASEH
jgi:hypothetical protein